MNDDWRVSGNKTRNEEKSVEKADKSNYIVGTMISKRIKATKRRVRMD